MLRIPFSPNRVVSLSHPILEASDAASSVLLRDFGVVSPLTVLALDYFSPQSRRASTLSGPRKVVSSLLAPQPVVSSSAPLHDVGKEVRAALATLADFERSTEEWLRNDKHWGRIGHSLDYLGHFLKKYKTLKSTHDGLDAGLRRQALSALFGFPKMVRAVQKRHAESLRQPSQSGSRHKAALRYLTDIEDFSNYLSRLKLERFENFFPDADREEFLRGIAIFADKAKSRTADNLWRFLSLPRDLPADFESQILPDWQYLSAMMAPGATHPLAAQSFEDYEIRAFRAKMFQPAFQNTELARKARALYDGLSDAGDRTKFLRVLLYGPQADELIFIIDNLSLYKNKYYDFGDFISSLYSDFNTQYVTGQKLRGFYFELEMLVLLSSKGAGVAVVQGGTDKPMGQSDATQEIDLHIAVHDPLGKSVEFYIELFSGEKDPGSSKKAQLDRYALAADAPKIGIAIFTKGGTESRITTHDGLSVLRLGWSALQAMTGADLSRLLFVEYARIREQIEKD